MLTADGYHWEPQSLNSSKQFIRSPPVKPRKSPRDDHSMRTSSPRVVSGQSSHSQRPIKAIIRRIKCNQCDYESYCVSNFRRNLKIHSGENSNKSMWCILSYWQFEDSFEYTQWRIVKQMQSVWLYILRGRQLEETFENTQWRKVKQMLSV